jgi:hypothetical protein
MNLFSTGKNTDDKFKPKFGFMNKFLWTLNKLLINKEQYTVEQQLIEQIFNNPEKWNVWGDFYNSYGSKDLYMATDDIKIDISYSNTSLWGYRQYCNNISKPEKINLSKIFGIMVFSWMVQRGSFFTLNKIKFINVLLNNEFIFKIEKNHESTPDQLQELFKWVNKRIGVSYITTTNSNTGYILYLSNKDDVICYRLTHEGNEGSQ